jgi:glyoxylase-like metal-dependent hydrolase (beta-lactamase superfamily II)
MLIAGFPAGPWGTNCYVVATGPGAECLVIDPGKDAAPGVAEVVREHRLKPVSVLLTHGHIDHMWSVTPVAGTYDATAWIHPADRHLLTDPLAGMSPETSRMLLGTDLSFAEPDDVRELGDGDALELAGLAFTVDHTPGHTPGLGHVPHPVRRRRARGHVRRRPALRRLDRTHRPARRRPRPDAAYAGHQVLPLDDRIVVLPGHGEQTTIGRERAVNPYLADLPSPTSPGRGL